MSQDRRGAAASEASAASRAALAELRYGAAFSHGNVLSERRKRRILSDAAQRGLRILPYPFASAVSIVSDLDGTSRKRYDGYVGQFVGELGLDFGDSTWLQWVSERIADRREWDGHGEPSAPLPHQALHAGFLSYDFGLGLEEPASVYRLCRSFAEHLAEFHLGNVDHFHSLLPKGPRVVVLERPRIGEQAIEFRPHGFEPKGRYCCYDTLLVHAVCIVAKPGRSLPELAVELVDRDGAATGGYRQLAYPNPPNNRQHRLMAILPPIDPPRLPRLNRVAKVVLRQPPGGDPASVERVLLLTAFGELLLDRLAWLRGRYRVELGLVTDHAAVHFRNEAAAAHRDRHMKEQHEAGELLRALPGTLTDDHGEVVFSTEADDPTSTCRVLPEMSREHGLRFVVPAGNTASSAGGWQPLDLVTPARTRADSGIYIARRMLPNIREPLPGKAFDGTRSQHSTLVERLERVLDGAAQAPGLLWPLYTHLGALGKNYSAPAPSPFFDEAVPRRLQDRVFGISGSVPAEHRAWFCRASVLYDYALMLRQVTDHVERPDADTVRIRSWHDPILDRTLPVAASQLYGLTFYVDDARRARVLLDDEPIEWLVRNPADETGRASVTIAACEIRHVLFERLDPTRNLPAQIELEGDWRWREDGGRAYGRLAAPTAGEGDAPARLRLPLFGLEPWGAQLLCFDARLAPGARLALVLETRTGGRFFFGDGRLLDAWGAVPTASYLVAPGKAPAWRRHVVPFHDLAWGPEARPGGPMPNHPLEALTVLAALGADGRGVEVANVALLRPRATQARSTETFCMGGSVPGSAPRQPVFAAPAGEASAERLECAVDPRGHFFFASLPPGIYRVWTKSAGRVLHDRRGRLVELSADLATLVLDRPAD